MLIVESPKNVNSKRLKELKTLVNSGIPIPNYNEHLKNVMSVCYYVENNILLSCLFLTNNNEIIFYRTNPKYQGLGYGKLIFNLILELKSLKTLTIRTKNQIVINFILKNGFELMETDTINPYSGNLTNTYIKNS